MRNTPRTRCHTILLALGLLAVLFLGGTWNVLEAAPSNNHTAPAPVVAAPIQAEPTLRHDPTHATTPVATRQEISDKEYAQAFRERVAKTLERLRSIKAARAERESRRAMRIANTTPIETAAVTSAPMESEANPPVVPAPVEATLPTPSQEEPKTPSGAIEIPLATSDTPEPVVAPAPKAIEIPLAAPVLPKEKPVPDMITKNKPATLASNPPATKTATPAIEHHTAPAPTAQEVVKEIPTPTPAPQIMPTPTPQPLVMATPADPQAPVMESRSDVLFQKALSKMEKGKSRRMELARKSGIVLPSQGGDISKVSPALSHLNQAVKTLIDKLP